MLQKGNSKMATKQQKLEYALSLSIHKEFRSHEILNFVINNYSLGDAEFKTYHYLLGLSNNNNGVCFPSGNYLATKLGVSRQRVVQIIGQLKEKGLLLVEQLEKGGSNFYIIATIEYMQNKILAKTNEIMKKAAANIKSVMDKASEKASEAVETLQEVASKVKKVIKKFAPKSESKPSQDNKPYDKKPYGKKTIRTEIVPEWLNKTYVPPVQTEEEKRRIEADKKELMERLKNL